MNDETVDLRIARNKRRRRVLIATGIILAVSAAWIFGHLQRNEPPYDDEENQLQSVNLIPYSPESVLQVLDACCGSYSFPMLDNGYVYLAASRLSLHRSRSDWALVIEIFGFSPRSGRPDLHVHTFGSRLYNRNRVEDYVTPDAHRRYLENEPNNEGRFFHPIDEGAWMDENNPGMVARSGSVTLRGRAITLPTVDRYHTADIDIQDDRPAIFDLCRCLAHYYRGDVLATDAERRVSVPPELTEILVLDDWHHPDVAILERPSETDTFRQLAEVLVTGDVTRYNTSEPHNTDWRNWPEGGTL